MALCGHFVIIKYSSLKDLDVLTAPHENDLAQASHSHCLYLHLTLGGGVGAKMGLPNFRIT